jgi:hypothetical protein
MCRPVRIARIPRDLHREMQQVDGRAGIQPAARKALERGLIRGRDRHVRAGGEVRVVHCADHCRLLEQHARRPERVAQVGATGFEFGGEGAVEQGDAALGDKWCEGIVRVARCHGGIIAQAVLRRMKY